MRRPHTAARFLLGGVAPGCTRLRRMRFGLLRWFAGLAAPAVLWAGATLYLQGTVETDLAAGAREALGAEAWAKVTARGRDLDVEGEAPSSADQQRALSA